MTDFKIATETGGLNQALFSVTHGLYILTSRVGEKINGQCLDSLMQVTSMPPRLAIGVGKRSLTHEMIMESGIFVANAIDRGCPACYDDVRRFGFQSGRKVDKFADRACQPGELGAPVIPEALAFFECRVIREMMLDLGTHTLFVAEVKRAGTHDSGEPLTYNEYRRVMKKK